MRDNTERLRPPRFLWTPFELGRPFGAPNEAAFQTRVLRSVLGLFDRPGPPPVLLDFPDDPPGAPVEMTGWTCPIPLPPALGRSESDAAEPVLRARLQAEIDQLSPWRQLAEETRGRTATGVLGVSIEDIVGFLCAFVDSGDPDDTASVLKPGVSLGETTRQACEELKTYYMEAATARPGAFSSRDIADWFWGATVAGELLLSLNPVLLAHGDPDVRYVAQSQLTPRLQQHRLRPSDRSPRNHSPP